MNAVIIGLDARGDFAAMPPGSGFESSAVAAATVPTRARAEIDAWTHKQLAVWRREDLQELHAAPMSWEQRRAVCAMLGARGDLHVSVIVTSNLLLRSAEAVKSHRARQLRRAEDALSRAATDDGRKRGERIVRLLAGRRVGQSRLTDGQYVLAAMVPLAVMGAAQRALCFYAGDRWRPEMAALELGMDEDTPATVRYVSTSLLPTIGGDERFRLITPDHWRMHPVHPLLAQARHPDGDGYWPQRLVGDEIDWVSSHEEPAVQVADFAAWMTCRAIDRPDEQIARECFDLLRPLLVGAGGRCFELFAIGDVRPEDAAMYSHLHSDEEPSEWLRPTIAA